ncbi:DNA-formamidopyrimidine glycosylase [Lactococcus paracarnosus]|uniref:Formamidopyrimidine-DNA glycosylase n=1 Tax=Pseudolactococcus paracarnosus TaxID=2749962 RepID=A0A7L4WHI6_9LACT|nr:DNA-formamidopyrimidine glycosylase [Lactococcus paracarnosus]SPC37441.1 Formamidopyrimidine-DNA glycosylase [Lactococcus piscium]MCJ1976810.1 DNA-formamidopyrimidine glycosylase [Lactococcus paracarnosus]MCJ1982804.1 DNA-formamidopyrimidine glycosylase [Lactococcus paracarnosus]MCJ1993458.1 DNA-formamidopyrimidine glycosylase [Lactococcus paracarnosus]MCJ1997465.1 DNA-formamidopyrimidine glycosylase [Lactococcus paracarnosus]
MPELPEVETVRRGLNKLVSGQKINAVHLNYQRMIKSDLSGFLAYLPGKTILTVSRRGKYLLFEIGDKTLVSHLRMEGKYQLFPSEAVPDHKHFHAFFTLSNGQTLVYQDVRKFGTMELVDQGKLLAFFKGKKIGPEPIASEFTLAPFQEKLIKSTKKIKPYLLDQTLVAGLGNIYVDEVLWLSKIHPSEIASNLSKKQIAELRQAIISVLDEGVKRGGSTIRSYKNALGMAGTMQDCLKVYAKKDQPCQRCGRPIEKYKLSGRGTHFCPHCQHLKKG